MRSCLIVFILVPSLDLIEVSTKEFARKLYLFPVSVVVVAECLVRSVGAVEVSLECIRQLLALVPEPIFDFVPSVGSVESIVVAEVFERMVDCHDSADYVNVFHFSFSLCFCI